MEVLVTGAAGFLGSHLTESLARRGDTVTGVDRRVAPPVPWGRHLVEDVVAGGGTWRREAAAADAVVHLAARPGVRAAEAGVEAARRRDILDSTRAVMAATPLRTPLIVVSSSAVYGDAPTGRGSREDDPLRPVGSYGQWKLRVEALCSRRRAQGGLVSVARPFTVAGPRQRPDMAVSRWLSDALAGRPATVLGGLDRTRDVSDVDDVTAGLLALVDRGVHDRLGVTVNLGPGTPRSHADVLDAVARVTGTGVDVVVRPSHPDEVRHSCADPSLARDVLGIDPHTDLDDVVGRQLSAMAHGETPIPIRWMVGGDAGDAAMEEVRPGTGPAPW
ncbi:MAG: NAD-dependent epimerase/dehydratase family protein [Kineosporiaceae bacterium]